MNQRPGFHPDKTHITVIKVWLEMARLNAQMALLVESIVFVNMKFDPRQASDRFHINKNIGII